jgi:hypothetical protein
LPKNEFKKENFENEIIFGVSIAKFFQKKIGKGHPRFLYLVPLSSQKYEKMIKLLYLHIWLIARFG